MTKLLRGHLKSQWIGSVFFAIVLMTLSVNANASALQDKFLANPLGQQGIDSLEDQSLHSYLVNLALMLDLYSEKCRGMSVNKYFNAVNRLYINKYSLSANNYIEQFFRVEVRDYKAQQERQFMQTLAGLKGCKGARDQKWDRQKISDYNALFRKAEDSGWFPVVDHVAPADLE